MRFALFFLFAFSVSGQNLVIDSYKFVQSSSSLNTGLISHWSLEEASGTRVDSEPIPTAQDLTDNNTVTNVAGIIGNAAFFTAANTEWLSILDSTDLSVGDEDFTISAWVKLTSLTTGVIASHWSTTPSQQRSWRLWFDSAIGKYKFSKSNNSFTSGETNVADTIFGTPPTNAWHFIVASHDSINNQLKISTNDDGGNTLGDSTGVWDSSAAFDIGARGAGADPWDGAIDEVSFWKRILTATEITWLYNGGAGRTYPYAGGP